jgi:acetyl esterase/lipase
MREQQLIQQMRSWFTSQWCTLLLLLLGFGLTGCSPVRVVNGLSPDSHYQLTADVPYGANARQKLDLYVPVAARGTPPVVVFFYGGGWRKGSKEHYEFVASSLTKAGYVVIIPDYRLFPEVRFPGFVEDGARAVAWTMQHAGQYGADPDEIFLMGHSAGAHIAALLAMDRRYMAAHAIDPGKFNGFIGLSGPYDFLPIESGYLRDVFPEDQRAASQPINFVSAEAPPTLLIHGTGDHRVYVGNSERLARRLSGQGADVTIRLYEGAGHAVIAASLAPPLDFTQGTFEDIRTFVETRRTGQ